MHMCASLCVCVRMQIKNEVNIYIYISISIYIYYAYDCINQDDSKSEMCFHLSRSAAKIW